MRPGGSASAGVLVALSLASFATTASANTPRIPSCAQISRTALAKLAQTGPLTLDKKIGNLCEFHGSHKDHYQPTFEIQLIPYINRVWTMAEGSAQFTAAKNGSVFGHANKNLFDVSGSVTDKGLQPCMPDLGTPGNGESLRGPVCSPEPPEVQFSAYGRGTDARNGLKLMVSAGLTGQQGVVHLSRLLELSRRSSRARSTELAQNASRTLSFGTALEVY